jgi:hypothetical protein
VTIQFTQAKRDRTNLLIALAGASGSGKTYSALRLASGLLNGAGNGRIAFVDTEAGRAEHYADQFDFDHHIMQPPFTPARFTEIINAAQEQKYPVLIIDSFSDEYEGVGGLMEMAESNREKFKGNTAAMWGPPKMDHRRLMARLRIADIHLIFCLRAEEKVALKGKEVVQLGWMPVAEKKFMYDMTLSLTLRPDAPGQVDWQLPHKLQDQHRGAFQPGRHIEEGAGRFLKEWAQGGASMEGHKELWDKARQVANEGRTAFLDFWKPLDEADRKIIMPILPELHAATERVERFADDNPFEAA